MTGMIVKYDTNVLMKKERYLVPVAVVLWLKAIFYVPIGTKRLLGSSIKWAKLLLRLKRLLRPHSLNLIRTLEILYNC